MKRSRRHQQGHVFPKGGCWYLRYRIDELQENGTVKHVQRCHKLVEKRGEYRTKKSVQVLADEYLAPINNGTVTPHSTMSLVRYVNDWYLPYVNKQKRPSTYRGYLNLWKRYLEPRGDIALREFRTMDGERILQEIVQQHDLTCTTMAHIKAFLSGVFRYAKRQGVLNSPNPIPDVVLPSARRPGETYAYSLAEIQHMLRVLPEPAATVVATAAFTGVRKGELRGLLWEHYDGQQIRITQSVWRRDIKEPKTKKSMAPVPIIGVLGERLDLHRALSGKPTKGLVFASAANRPLNVDALARDVIRPIFEKANLKWHGWHAFRRGLATNLHRLGVPDKTIQAILRHSNVAVTQACYIKSVAEDAASAMRILEEATIEHTPSQKCHTN